MLKKFRLGELSYVFAMILIALGVVFATKSGFGVSAIVAPAYIIHLKMTSLGFAWFTFGMSQYVTQGLMMLLLCIAVRRFRWRYLGSFLTSVIYGFLIDGWTFVLGQGTYTEMYARILSLIAGIVITSFAIALFFRTYLPQQIYELFVAEIVAVYKFPLSRVKLIFDISMLGLAVVLIFAMGLNFFDGIGIGTLATALVNVHLITLFGKPLDKVFCFDPAFPRFRELLK